MKIDERLRTICDECASKGKYTKTACPFRSISNDFCDNIETLQKDLERLEKLEKENAKLLKTITEINTEDNEEIAEVCIERDKLKKALKIYQRKSYVIAKDKNPEDKYELIILPLTREEAEVLKELEDGTTNN